MCLNLYRSRFWKEKNKKKKEEEAWTCVGGMIEWNVNNMLVYWIEARQVDGWYERNDVERKRVMDRVKKILNEIWITQNIQKNSIIVTRTRTRIRRIRIRMRIIKTKQLWVSK